MEAYKFQITVQENGVIQIPEIKVHKHQVIDSFLSKWRGVLKDADPEDLKARYLQEKYE